MSPGEESEARIRRLLRDLEADLVALDGRADEIRVVLSAAQTPPSAAVLAVALHHYYTAFESALERSVRFLDGALPDGPDWHRGLLREATQELPGVRPAIASASCLPEWEQLLRFRHFFRHAYAVALDLARLWEHGERVQRLHPTARADLESLRARLRDAVAAMSHAED